jgi:hypothetical protein
MELLSSFWRQRWGASLDPLERAEFHRGLAEKFLREAEELLTRGDYVQASEKAWGAAAHRTSTIYLNMAVYGELTLKNCI